MAIDVRVNVQCYSCSNYITKPDMRILPQILQSYSVCGWNRNTGGRGSFVTLDVSIVNINDGVTVPSFGSLFTENAHVKTGRITVDGDKFQVYYHFDSACSVDDGLWADSVFFKLEPDGKRFLSANEGDVHDRHAFRAAVSA